MLYSDFSPMCTILLWFGSGYFHEYYCIYRKISLSYVHFDGKSKLARITWNFCFILNTMIFILNVRTYFRIGELYESRPFTGFAFVNQSDWTVSHKGKYLINTYIYGFCVKEAIFFFISNTELKTALLFHHQQKIMTNHELQQLIRLMWVATYVVSLSRTP